MPRRANHGRLPTPDESRSTRKWSPPLGGGSSMVKTWLGTITLAGLSLFALSCNRDSGLLAPPETPDAAARAQVDHTSEFITVQRHSLRLETRGALRPGSPITIRLSAKANRPS